MDTLAHPAPVPRTTQAAEGLLRWRWSTAEIVRLAELGAFSDMDRFELIGGEIVPMSAAGRRHQIVADRLARLWMKRDLSSVHIGEEKQFSLDDATYTKPDILIWPATLEIPDVRGDTALLVVEIAKSSLKKDTGFKKRLYASFGVREYWVIDAEELLTRVHRNPKDGDYETCFDVAANAIAIPALVPILSVQLDQLGL
jgi:Uma2 family endonuclease